MAAIGRGPKHLENWIVQLAVGCGEVVEFEMEPGVEYLHRDSIEALFRVSVWCFQVVCSEDSPQLRQIFDMEPLGFQAFFDILQQQAEDWVRA